MLTATFEITIEGEIDPACAGALAPAVVTLGAGRTRLRADEIDQAGLHALLDRVADLGLVLTGVAVVPPADPDDPPRDGGSGPPGRRGPI